MRMTHKLNANQRGAALVIGLILLLVLTLLAISGVSSASLEFFMAGNEQYRQNAFQAAEAGIERAMANGALFNPNGALPAINGTNGVDTFTASVTPAGKAPAPPKGYDATLYAAYLFQIDSTGRSDVRNAQAANTQGVGEIVNASTVFPPVPSATCTSLYSCP